MGYFGWAAVCNLSKPGPLREVTLPSMLVCFDIYLAIYVGLFVLTGITTHCLSIHGTMDHENECIDDKLMVLTSLQLELYFS